MGSVVWSQSPGEAVASAWCPVHRAQYLAFPVPCSSGLSMCVPSAHVSPRHVEPVAPFPW